MYHPIFSLSLLVLRIYFMGLCLIYLAPRICHHIKKWF